MIELPMSSTLMISAAVRSSLRALAIRDCSCLGVGLRRRRKSAASRATPVSKPDRPSASFGKQKQREADHHERVRLLREQVPRPVRDEVRVRRQLEQLVADEHDVQAR